MPAAARVGDMHMCPMVTPGTPPIPHVGGPILPPGCPTVLIAGQPAARVGDMATCVGPPDTILLGAFTVLIGGQPAARMGDSAAHGGAIALGCPTVQIGPVGSAVGGMAVTIGPGGVVQVGNAITISGPPGFQAQVLERLALIASTKSGMQTLNSINGSGKTMNIIPFTGNNSFCGANTTWTDFAGQTPKGKPVFDGSGNPIMGPDGKTQLVGTGTGANTTLQLNPNLTLPNSLAPSNPMPNDAILFHEMTHGSHQMTGTADTSPAGGGWDTMEEKNTISSGTPSEADYLKEQGYPYHRTDHATTFAPNT